MPFTRSVGTGCLRLPTPGRGDALPDSLLCVSTSSGSVFSPLRSAAGENRQFGIRERSHHSAASKRNAISRQTTMLVHHGNLRRGRARPYSNVGFFSVMGAALRVVPEHRQMRGSCCDPVHDRRLRGRPYRGPAQAYRAPRFGCATDCAALHSRAILRFPSSLSGRRDEGKLRDARSPGGQVTPPAKLPSQR